MGRESPTTLFVCSSTSTGLGDNMSASDLLELWAADPVHLNPEIAEVLTIAAEKGEKTDGRSCQQKKPAEAKRKTGISRSDVTASRWR